MFAISYYPDVLSHDLAGVNRDIRDRLKSAIENRLMTHPHDYGKPLRGELRNLWSLRTGDCRIIYQIHKDLVVIIRIAHRKDAYKAGIIEARLKGLI